jgi:hypothetical protein
VASTLAHRDPMFQRAGYLGGQENSLEGWGLAGDVDTASGLGDERVTAAASAPCVPGSHSCDAAQLLGPF